ncbi:ABC transporter substrate-binding protein [Lentzea sp. DG1S-22]|uniref:ABC transporter substrate-binding protein n=1 Tax=Lentzea sp. DG1S-22 TaxID=3108822 RepID=UPI002E77934C|nr:ABC transporter substrate-binding protein [Lentzea sp. DG1S-22]WVH82409.1 ABC transporter substrate-binding protein [Lentzea sp. DG1S-22]
MRRIRKALVLMTAAALLASCGSAADDSRLTISVATFGDFGYESLFREYESRNPGVKLVARIAEFEDHHTKLATHLAGGRGAADVVAIEEGHMPRLRQSFDKFVNLADLGALTLREQYAPWKWDQGLAGSGKVVLGLGTDMGSLALCYRKDYFAAAGLPTDRSQVGALWPTWEAYAQVAERFSAAKPDIRFVDTAASIYTTMLNQAEEGYFSRTDDSFIGDREPRVRAAFDLAGKFAEAGWTAKLTPYSQEWTVAIRQGTFATTPCPAWMLALLRNAGGEENKGRWDVTAVPGGGGNQGGSFLAVPAQGKHTERAYDVARFLTAPEQQKRIFLENGNLPSQPGVYRAPEVLAKTDDYFNGAPVGSIYATTADALRPNYRGVRDFLVRPKFTTALNRVETGRQSTADAWQRAVSESRDALK